MNRNLRYVGLALVGVFAAMATGCSSSRYASSTKIYYDNMYGVHDRTAIASAERSQDAAIQAEIAARKASVEAMLAQTDAETDGIQLDRIDPESYMTGYNDGYESAYARKLAMFEDPYYTLPASYYTYYYDTAYLVNGVYGPGFYDITIIDGNVSVTPVYMTPWNYYWNYPYYSPFYFSSYSPWWSLGWGISWTWGWGWNWYYGHP